MEKQLQEVIGLMQKNLECAICLELLKNPVSTKCDHQFCRFCIQEFLKTKVSVPCPLCKKPITKRSLVDRSNLSHIVDNVRSLISAFQEDTGQLFSPPRGSQMCFLPCTPETISCKTNIRNNKRKSAEDVPVAAKNVRQTKRRKSEPTTRGSHMLNKDDELGQITQALLAEIEADDHSRNEPVEQVGSKHVGTVPSSSSTLTNLENNHTPANQTHTNVRWSRRMQRHCGREHMKENDEVTSLELSSRKETSLLLPCNDSTDLLNYLATESCGADLVSTRSRRHTRSRSANEKLQDVEDHGDVTIISENEKENITADDDDNKMAVGQSLISLGNRAKTLKAKLNTEMDKSERESKEFDKRVENQSLFQTSKDNTQIVDDEKSGNYDEKENNKDVSDDDDGFVLQKSHESELDASRLTNDKRKTRSSGKNLVYFNLKSSMRKSREQSSDQDEHKSDPSVNVFGAPPHSVARTYSRKVKDNKVKKWIKNATQDLTDKCIQDISENVDKRNQDTLENEDKRNQDISENEDKHNQDISENEDKRNQDISENEDKHNQDISENDVDNVVELDSVDEDEKESCFGFAAIDDHVMKHRPQKNDKTIQKSDERCCDTKSVSKTEAVTRNGQTTTDNETKKTLRNSGRKSRELPGHCGTVDSDLVENLDIKITENPNVTMVTRDKDPPIVMPLEVEEETLNMDHLTPIVGKRKIFKSKSSNHGHFSMSVTQHKGKLSVTKVTEESEKDSVHKLLQEKTVAKETKDSQDSDPYEFKSSQRTPVRGKAKKKKMHLKPNIKAPIDFKVKNRSKRKVEKKQIVIDLTEDDGKQSTKQNCRTTNTKLQSTKVSLSEDNSDREPKRRKKSPRQKVVKFEDLEKIKEDLCQAEEYDLITCTQEATDTLAEDTDGQSVVSDVEIIPDSNLEVKSRSEEEVIPDTNTENIRLNKFVVPLPVMRSASKSVGKKQMSLTESSCDDKSCKNGTNMTRERRNSVKMSPNVAAADPKSKETSVNTENLNSDDNELTEKVKYSKESCDSQDSAIPGTFETGTKMKNITTKFNIRNHSKNRKLPSNDSCDDPRIQGSTENTNSSVTLDAIITNSQAKNSMESQGSTCNCIPDTCNDESESFGKKLKEPKTVRMIRKKSVYLVDKPANTTGNDSEVSENTSGSGGVYNSHSHAKDHGSFTRVTVLDKDIGKNSRKLRRRGNEKKDETEEVPCSTLTESHNLLDTEKEPSENSISTDKTEQIPAAELGVVKSDKLEVRSEVKNMAAESLSDNDVEGAVLEYIEKNLTTFNHQHGIILTKDSQKTANNYQGTNFQDSVSTQPPSVDMDVEMTNKITQNNVEDSTNGVTSKVKRRCRIKTKNNQSCDQHKTSIIQKENKLQECVVLETQLSGKSQTISSEDSVSLLQTTFERGRSSAKNDIKLVGVGENSSKMNKNSVTSTVQEHPVDILIVPNNTVESTNNESQEGGESQQRIKHNGVKISGQVTSISDCNAVVYGTEESSMLACRPSDGNVDGAVQSAMANLEHSACRGLGNKNVDIVPCTAGASDDITPIITIHMESQSDGQGNKEINEQPLTEKKTELKECHVSYEKGKKADSQGSVIVLSGSTADDKLTQEEKQNKLIQEKSKTVGTEINVYNVDEDIQILNKVNLQKNKSHKNQSLKMDRSNRLKKKGKVIENSEHSVEDVAVTRNENSEMSVENIASPGGNKHTKSPECKVLSNDQIEKEDENDFQLNGESELVGSQKEDEDDNLTPVVVDLDDNVEGDDLTPTLVPLEKSHHSAKKVTNYSNSPDDIFMMESECVDSQQAKLDGVEQFSLVQNQEGIMGIDFQSFASNLPDQISQVMHRSQSNASQNLNNNKTGQSTRSEDTASRDDLQSNNCKDEQKPKDDFTATKRNTHDVGCNRDGKEKISKEEESDSDLSQETRRKSGIRAVRGLASRMRHLNNSIIPSVQEFRDHYSNSCVNESQDATTHFLRSDMVNKKLNVENTSHDDHHSENTDICENKGESVKIVDSQSIITENKEPEINKDSIHKLQKEGNQKQGVKLRKTFKKKFVYQLKTDVSSVSAGSSSSVMSSEIETKRTSSKEDKVEHIRNISDQDFGEKKKSSSAIPDSSDGEHLHETDKHQICSSADEPDFSEIVEKGKAELNKKTKINWQHNERQESCIESQRGIDSKEKVQGNSDICQVVNESEDEFFEASSPLPDFNTVSTTAVEHKDHNRISMVPAIKLSSSESRRKLSDEEDFDVDDDDNLIIRRKTPVMIGDDSENEISEQNRNDDDDDDDVITKKKRKPNVIEDDDDEENNENVDVHGTDTDGYTSDDSTSRQLNLTSSSAFSSQSEAANTQNRQKLVTDLERMRKEIADLENQLAANVVPVPECSSFTENHKKSETSDKKLGPDQKIQGQDVMDVASSASTSRSLSKSQTSRGSVLEESGDEDSDDLFLSPLPPSPPPESAQVNTEIQLRESLAEMNTFLNQFRIPDQNSESKKKESSSTCTPLKSRVVMSSHDAGLHSSTDFGTPMFENRTPLVRSALSPIVNYHDNSEEDLKSQRVKAFVATGLTYPQMRELQKFAQQNECKFYTKFNSAVTHVVVKTDPVGSCICERTLKFFQAISHKCWILDFQWVLDSKAAGHMLPEVKYEVVGDTVTGDCHKGPRRSRTSTQPLLSGFQICCVGDSDGLTIDNLQELITSCGGTVVPDIENLTDESRIRLVVTCTDLDEEEDIPTPDEVRGFNQIYRQYSIVTVSREWVLDSLTVFNVQPLEEYVLTSVKRMRIPSLINQ